MDNKPDFQSEREARWHALTIAHDRARLTVGKDKTPIEEVLSDAEKIHQYIQKGPE